MIFCTMNRFCIQLVTFMTLIPALHFSKLVPFPAPYLGTGYDLRVGNPEGKSLYTNDGDPGLKPTRSIILNDPECPFCAAKVMVVNDWFTKEYLADDLIKYYQQIQDRWINSDEDEQLEDVPCKNSTWYKKKPILKVGGSCQSLAEAKRLLTVKKHVMVTNEISHIYKEARLINNHKNNLDPEFKDVVCNLSKNFTEDSRKEFINFFKTWGTHVIMELSLGEREIQRKLFSEEMYFITLKSLIRSSSFDVSSNYDAKSIPELFEKFSEIRPYKNYTFVRGSKDVPIPIKMHLEPIYNFVSCSGENDSVSKEMMKEATKDYLASDYKDPQFVVRKPSFNWPLGTYSLPKPRLGCPENWLHGYRLHDTEDTRHRNSYHRDWDRLMHPREARDSFFRFDFCSKIHKHPSPTAEWGKGSYCIFKYGDSCPSGFNDANIFIDDEDSNNGNKMNGILPSGRYDNNTRYDLCCRNDGETYFQLFLPNEYPFVLLPALIPGKTLCQEVFGMNLKMLWATIDGEDSKTSSCSGSSAGPLCERGDEFNTLKIYFCHYEPIVKVVRG